MAEEVVLLTNPIHGDGVAILERHARLIVAPDTKADTLRQLARGVSGIIVRAQLPDDIADHAPGLKGIVRHGVGLDFIPVPQATAKGIVVANLPGSNTNAVAEYVFAAILDLRRGAAVFDRDLRDAGWDRSRSRAEKTTEISPDTLGIIGVGAIGSRVAQIAGNGFGMRVIGTSRRTGNLPAGVQEVELDRIFEEADVVVLSCTLTDETRGLVDARRLALMKPTAVLINVSRGAVIETSSLRDALITGQIAGAALDVHDLHPLPQDDPIYSCPNLMLSPHVAAITATSSRVMSTGAAEEMCRILAGEPPLNCVNPEVLGS
ncbi:NAD(P)-dependent oxidoreductase [Oceaniovalibus sp. ACAM 378]|uniref:NAD(P)-dependent oxidoreductase n=1 Tax=Oceaniovalibus sp. ACAM 378 TaxID=2599923 RepID=UPI0011D3AAEC|nr:NAD(P)-dependent oxidoreductase [Oceaniovalibus sp. ACAM 378]TYB90027.1 hydroxyacid dehydrogenase [Oceaniovalibus sp. ACAM 378]